MSAGSGDDPDNADAHAFENEGGSDALPEIVRADHYDKALDKLKLSFPLLAMQFVLRHFVRCTEFCLVCHRKLESDVEAIKPYVCDSPLCLYQYMALGLGPSIEHEVVAQPYVVDLLVSFCYNSAVVQKLRHFPDGLSLVVPPADFKPTEQFATFQVQFDQSKRELTFRQGQLEKSPVSRGQWILLKSSSLPGQDLHCRVADAAYFPTISIDKPVSESNIVISASCSSSFELVW
jgi:ubiquitin-conjugating enzyme E2 Q